MRPRTIVALGAVLLTLGVWLANAGAQPGPTAQPGQPPAPPEQPEQPAQPTQPQPPGPAEQPAQPARPPRQPAPPPPEAAAEPDEGDARPDEGAEPDEDAEPDEGDARRRLPEPDTKRLPPGHPPLGKGQLPTRPRRRPNVRTPRPLQQAPEQERPKFPRDEHGHCLHDGPDDPPREINLVHGWLGVDNDAAVPPPRREGMFDWDWWKWRLTPYPWRYENHGDECDPRNQPTPLIAMIINIAVLVLILVRFGRQPLADALERRRESVMSEIDRAQDIKRSAEKRLDHYEDELDNLDERLVELRAQYAAEGEHEEKRVREEAASTRQRMLADAEFRLSQESKTARDDLSREALEGALSAAEEMLEHAVTSADHDRLEKEFLDQLEASLKDGDLS